MTNKPAFHLEGGLPVSGEIEHRVGVAPSVSVTLIFTSMRKRPACRVPRARALLFMLALAAGCGVDDSNIVRGRGLAVAGLSPRDQAAIYSAALNAAFDLPDPALSLLLDPRKLPRTAGMAPADTLPPDVQHALRAGGVVTGTCKPPIASKTTPRCAASLPGYVVRFSDILRQGRDSVQVYVAVQKYDTRTSPPTESLRFEKVYQVTGGAERWRAVREGRLRSQ